MATFVMTTHFEPLTCFRCGVVFGVPLVFYNALMRPNGGPAQEFFCPNGHGQIFTESRLDKAERELASVRAQKDQVEAEARDLRAKNEKAERSLARIKKRVQHGVCTKCNRTFQNVARHMATRHAEKCA